MSELQDHELIEELMKRFDKTKHALLEVQELNKELKEVNKKLEESEALKSHFISNITNEIMNPFSSILALSRNIMNVGKEDWSEIQKMVTLIYSESFNLDFQLRNIFVAAKLEAGDIFPEILNVDVKLVIESVIESFKYESDKKNLDVELEFDIKESSKKPFYFKTDAEKLKLIVTNHLFNAIKYSYEKGKIIIKVWIQDDKLNISVKDFGTGLSEENQKIIFDRFKRIDTGINSLNRGHGLGLSINKALIDLLDGKINIQSKPEKGSDFTVSIPESTVETTGIAIDGNELFFDDETDDEKEIF
jgi:signal transduction histidine kinase